MTSPVAAGSTSSATVAVGRYRLELGSRDGTFALFETEAEQEQAQAVTEALAAPAQAEESHAASTAESKAEELLADASTVTERTQRCLTLFTEIAEGNALDPKVVSRELDSLLALLGRLDREGRHKEALRLARDLAALLALLLRWFDLVRSLQLALRLADELGGAGRCPSRHNLDAARRDLADRAALDRLRRRRLWRLTGVGAVLLFLATGGAALGIGLGSHRHASPPTSGPVTSPTHSTATATTGSSTAATTVPTTAPTTIVDVTAPQPTLTEPADGSLVATATPVFSGTAGNDAGDSATVIVTILNTDGNPAGGSPLTASRSGTTFSVSVPGSDPLSDGTYTATVEQVDAAGNKGTGTDISFTVDTTAPAVTLSCKLPLCFGTADELDQLVTVTVTDQGPAGTTPTPGASSTQTTPVASDHTFTVTVDTPASGEQYDVVATQPDAAGNVGTSRTVTVETPSPIP
jgi:hypothetical protein